MAGALVRLRSVVANSPSSARISPIIARQSAPSSRCDGAPRSGDPRALAAQTMAMAQSAGCAVRVGAGGPKRSRTRPSPPPAPSTMTATTCSGPLVTAQMGSGPRPANFTEYAVLEAEGDGLSPRPWATHSALAINERTISRALIGGTKRILHFGGRRLSKPKPIQFSRRDAVRIGDPCTACPARGRENESAPEERVRGSDPPRTRHHRLRSHCRGMLRSATTSIRSPCRHRSNSGACRRMKYRSSAGYRRRYYSSSRTWSPQRNSSGSR
jgi:hypothetical protein